MHAAATHGDSLSPILDNLQKKKRISLVPSIQDEICCVSGDIFRVAARINEHKQIQRSNTVISDAKSKTADIYLWCIYIFLVGRYGKIPNNRRKKLVRGLSNLYTA